MSLQIPATNLREPATGRRKTVAKSLLQTPEWSIGKAQRWSIFGGNNAQRTAVFSHIRHLLSEQYIAFSEVSENQQETFIEEENEKGKTGVADEIVEGTAAGEIIETLARQHPNGSAQRIDRLIELLSFEPCLDRAFRDLSSGETRKLLIILAFGVDSDYYLLFDPYEGLDITSRQRIGGFIEDFFANSGKTVFFFANRWQQTPEFTSHTAHIENQHLHLTEVRNRPIATHIAGLGVSELAVAKTTIPELPDDHPFRNYRTLDRDAPLVEMQAVSVKYSGQQSAIFADLDLTIRQGEHTHITGRNGAGKSTLLKLITGDHPQVYSNEITVCGYRRGAGESIWEVKRHIGYMGGEMLWNYRSSGQLAGKAISVVMSGLYDSIGLYTTANAADKHCARDWLELLGMADYANTRFHRLGMAEQRLVLIARAMIKRPALLLLDEPCQALDNVDRSRVLSVIEKLLETNETTVLYVSHYDDERVAGIERLFNIDEFAGV